MSAEVPIPAGVFAGPISVVGTPACWRSTGLPSAAPAGAPGLGAGLGVCIVVLLVHLAVLLLVLSQAVVVLAPEQRNSNAGPLRVGLVSSRPERVVVPAIPLPPLPPKLEKKVMATEAPSSREVNATKKKTEPAAVQPAAAPQLAAPAQAPGPATPAVAATSVAVTAAGNPEATGAAATPREVGQLSCRVPKPEYPRSARRRGDAGTVSIRLVVNEQGQVSKVDIEHSSGFPELDSSARQAALAAQCEPYRDGGRAIRVTALQSIQFVPSD